MRTKLEIVRCVQRDGATVWMLEGYSFDPQHDAAEAIARSIDRLGEMGKLVVQVIELPNDSPPSSFGLLVQD